MPTDTQTLTLALALTAGGAVVFAGLITGIVQILKTLAPGIVTGREQLLAFALSAVVVVAAMGAAIQAGALTLSIESGFAGFLAFYGIARIAMGVHDDITQQTNSVTGANG